MDKTMDDKLMQIPKDDKTKKPLVDQNQRMRLSDFKTLGTSSTI